MFRRLNLSGLAVSVEHFRNCNINFKTLSTKRITVDENELKHFARLSKEWWELNGEVKLLHSFNKCRVPWIANCLASTGVIQRGGDSSFKGLSFLDVGCGGGILSEALAHLGGKVTGLDATEDLIRIAQHHASTQHLPDLQYECATIQEHALKNQEKYDVVVSSETIEHVTEKEEFIKYSVQCLKPGGSILMTTPSKTWLSSFFTIFLAENVFCAIPKGTHTYDMFICFDDLIRIFKNENCEIRSTTGVMVNPLTHKWFLTKTKRFFYAIYATKKL